MRATCPAQLILLDFTVIKMYGNKRKVTVSKDKCAARIRVGIILIMTLERTPNTTTF